MVRKRIASMAAVLALLLGLTTDAFATAGGNVTVVEADTLLPDIVIEVTVPGTGQAYIYPQGGPVDADGKVRSGRVVSDPAYIENKTESPLYVSVSVTGEVYAESGLTLSGSTTQGVTTRMKRAFIYFQLLAAADPENVDWDDSYDADKDIIVREATKAKKNYVTLASASQNERFGVFRLYGDCVSEPRDPWTEADGFTATIVFTFKPAPLS